MVDFRRAVDKQLLLIVLLAEEVELKGKIAERERERGSHLMHSQKKGSGGLESGADGVCMLGGGFFFLAECRNLLSAEQTTSSLTLILSEIPLMLTH